MVRRNNESEYNTTNQDKVPVDKADVEYRWLKYRKSVVDRQGFIPKAKIRTQLRVDTNDKLLEEHLYTWHHIGFCPCAVCNHDIYAQCEPDAPNQNPCECCSEQCT